MDHYTALNLAAGIWFFTAWIGYTQFARRQAKTSHCLSSVLHIYRKNWMLAMLKRENRIADTALIASLERNASFLASTAILIIAGLVTIMASIDKVYLTLSTLPFAHEDMSAYHLQLKVVLLLTVYVYAFFSLTWAMRQYGFSSIVLGAAPGPYDTDIAQIERNRYAVSTAKIVDQAGHSYNYGLRAYYFSLAILPWLFDPWVFIGSTALVVVILYRREFHSRTLRILLREVKKNEASL